jgi:large subunit ribosomal protein L21
VYAIVKAGGRQEKVAVGDVLLIDRVNQAPGASIRLPALLVVDGAAVTTDSKALAGFTVTAEILEEIKGEKIHILRYKNKTGYRRRQGFRAKRTRIKVTEISKGE